MTFYWAMNINTWNGHETNELVQTCKFCSNVVVVILLLQNLQIYAT
ncbi:hypothetical protein MX156_15700 [Bacillus cytotoxicus]|nr:hypothetical protein [Bacillus cytotoxicus]MDH2893419.1 hypothetical protein [Bacillus cytotoxicus]